jgi:hypothetical protein
VFRHGLDTNGDRPGPKINRFDALGLRQWKEWIGHQILCIARRQIARQCAIQVELVTL